jgi:hypothetical protein
VISSKLIFYHDQWKGPYLVIKPINDLAYRVQLTPRSKPGSPTHWPISYLAKRSRWCRGRSTSSYYQAATAASRKIYEVIGKTPRRSLLAANSV